MGILRIAPLHKMSRRCTTVKDVPADQFIKKCADFLKRQPKFQVPKWADLVKTGHFKELAPYDEEVLHPCCIHRSQDLPSSRCWYWSPPPWHPHHQARDCLWCCDP